MSDDYFIGVHPRELERLKEQHEAWRPETLALWRRAGFGPGQWIADLGSGPGFTALELGSIVGADGRVTAFDKASRYLEFLREEALRTETPNVRAVLADMATLEDLRADETDTRKFDGAFCRFFLAFLVSDLDRVLRTIHRGLARGAVLGTMEYLTLGSATSSPSMRGFDAHTRAWVDYYLRYGGDSAIGRSLPAKLAAAGFEIEHVGCAGGLAHPHHRWWRWWGRLIDDFGEKLVAEGLLLKSEHDALQREWLTASARSDAFIHTPLVLQIIARKR